MKFSVIGGDLRLSNLAETLTKDLNEVSVYGMENSNEIVENKNIYKCSTVEEAVDKSDIIIGSIPFMKNNSEVYATFSDKNIRLDELVKKENKSKIFIAGSIPQNAKEKLIKSYGKVIDIMKEEELVVLNTIATAEGAVDVAIRNTDTIIHGSKVLILGFGRVAKEVANKFHGLSANVTCAARKKTDLAWIKAMGYKEVNINELGDDLKTYDIIINTVPHMIIDKEEMQYMNKNVLLIDLASSPRRNKYRRCTKNEFEICVGVSFTWKSCTCYICRVYKTNNL